MNTKKKFWNYERFIVITLFMVFGMVFMDRMAMIYLFPFIAPELGLTNTQLGMVAGSLAIAWAISNVVFATLSDFLGKRKMILIIFILLFSTFTFFSGFIAGFISLVLVRILMGIAEGPVIPLVNSAVMAESSPQRRGFNMGLVQSSGPLFGLALVPIIVVSLATTFDWRISFYFLAIPGFILAFILMKYMREPNLKVSETEAKTSKLTFGDYKQLFKQRNIVLNILISNFFMIFFTTMTAFSPLFLINIAKYTEQQTALFLFVLGLGIFFWNLVGPMISDKIGRKPALVMFTFISIFIPISVALLYNNFTLLLLLTFFLAAGMGYQPLSLAIIPAESVPRPLIASAIAIIVCIGEGIGGSLGPVLSGILADQFGLFSPLWVVAIACAIAFLLSFGIKETAPIKLLKIQNNALTTLHNEASVKHSEQNI